MHLKSNTGPDQSTGDKLFQYCTCPAGLVTYSFHLSCKHMHLSFKSICNKEHKGVICKMTSSNFSKSTGPARQVLWEELLILSRFRGPVEFLSSGLHIHSEGLSDLFDLI